jgi:F0F1-type ATP synthase assembly protein I
MQLGLTVVSSILLSLAAGLWIDNQFGTSPWATLVAMLLGAAAAFYGVYRLIMRVFADIDRDRRGQ